MDRSGQIAAHSPPRPHPPPGKGVKGGKGGGNSGWGAQEELDAVGLPRRVVLLDLRSVQPRPPPVSRRLLETSRSVFLRVNQVEMPVGCAVEAHQLAVVDGKASFAQK